MTTALVRLTAAAALLTFCSTTTAESTEDFLAGFIVGNYQLIGKSANNGESYSGRVKLRQGDNRVQVTRNINGITIQGSGAIEQVGPDNTPVLRIRFNQGNQSYEKTCLIGSDLDNYARITCHLYRSDQKSDSPWLEALFYQHLE